jgi:hypothetical protein
MQIKKPGGDLMTTPTLTEKDLYCIEGTFSNTLKKLNTIVLLMHLVPALNVNLCYQVLVQAILIWQILGQLLEGFVN